MNKEDVIAHLKHLVTANIIDGEVIDEMYSCLDSLREEKTMSVEWNESKNESENLNEIKITQCGYCNVDGEYFNYCEEGNECQKWEREKLTNKEQCSNWHEKENG